MLTLKIPMFFRLQEIESKLDTLKGKEALVVNQVTQAFTPEPRRLSLPGKFTSLTDLSTAATFDWLEKTDKTPSSHSKNAQTDNIVTIEDTIETEEDAKDDVSSTCSSPTLMELKTIRKVTDMKS